MSGPPATKPESKTTIREVAKQTRAFAVAGRVRVINHEGAVIDICAPDRLQRYLDAPNVELIHAHGGKLVAIKLLSVGDDRGHLGEGQRSSARSLRACIFAQADFTITTTGNLHEHISSKAKGL
jgi:hypothetical protein